MQKSGDLLQRMRAQLDLPPETLGRDSQVILCGSTELSIEGHRGIRLYGTERIEVRGLRGCICVDGALLQVVFLSQERLRIRGQISGLTLEDGE